MLLEEILVVDFSIHKIHTWSVDRQDLHTGSTERCPQQVLHGFAARLA